MKTLEIKNILPGQKFLVEGEVYTKTLTFTDDYGWRRNCRKMNSKRTPAFFDPRWTAEVISGFDEGIVETINSSRTTREAAQTIYGSSDRQTLKRLQGQIRRLREKGAEIRYFPKGPQRRHSAR